MGTDDDGWSSSVSGSVRMRHRDPEATASGIYGMIVSAAVLSASNADKAYKVMIAVVVTLTIYWGAERYARIVAERIHEGHRPNWTSVRYQLTHGWEMVTASAAAAAHPRRPDPARCRAAHGGARRAGLQHRSCSASRAGRSGRAGGCRRASGSCRPSSPGCSALFFVLLKTTLH